MGYYTSYKLEWKPQTEVTKEPNCNHPKDKNAKFCPECGLAIKTIDISDKISSYLKENRDTYYAIDEDGQTEEDCKWYEHREDILTLSQIFPTYLFTLFGEGEENGDIWKHYFLNGKSLRVEAKITYGRFDSSKLA